jgi:hypothetical protein
MNLPINPIFETHPDLLNFCQQTGILETVNELLDQGTDESRQQAKLLIEQTTFPAGFLKPETMIIGNGDVMNHDHGLEIAKEFGVDGIMIGRGIFKDPWAFLPREQAAILDTRENRIRLLEEHISNWQATWGDTKHFPVLKKFVKMYINGFPNSAELRAKFMEMSTPEEMLMLCNMELSR